jgi:hypothetical protein
MKTTRTYQSICTTCNGNGQLMDNPNATNPYSVCPVCNGAKTITVTETIEPESPVAQVIGREELIKFLEDEQVKLTYGVIEITEIVDSYLSTHPLQEKPSDEDIEIWAHHSANGIYNDRKLKIDNRIYGAKAMRDNKIPVKKG